MKELLDYISQPQNGIYNFHLGLWYEDRGHTAAAASFYIRSAEYSDDDILAYEALLRLSNCFAKQGSRVHLNKGILLRAIAHQPQRPEAYFLLSRLYEQNKDWEESYSFAVMGQQLSEDHSRLRTNVDYPGRYALIFQRAVAAWWIGLFGESLDLFRKLQKNTTMLPIHVEAVANNLKNLEGTVRWNSLEYDPQNYERLRVKFPGARDIKQNYSQMFQDLFVLTMLNGKKDGVFLEIGCGDPVFGSNTKLLEEWGWTGASVDINTELSDRFTKERACSFLAADATQLDFNTLIQHDYDYLQIDIEPPLGSLQVLLNIPLDKYRFGVITFEHDDYRSAEIKERSRRYLYSYGYLLVASDIAVNLHDSCEDWWIHPALVDPKIVEKMLNTKNGIKKADRYMLGPVREALEL